MPIITLFAQLAWIMVKCLAVIAAAAVVIYAICYITGLSLTGVAKLLPKKEPEIPNLMLPGMHHTWFEYERATYDSKNGRFCLICCTTEGYDTGHCEWCYTKYLQTLKQRELRLPGCEERISENVWRVLALASKQQKTGLITQAQLNELIEEMATLQHSEEERYAHAREETLHNLEHGRQTMEDVNDLLRYF